MASGTLSGTIKTMRPMFGFIEGSDGQDYYYSKAELLEDGLAPGSHVEFTPVTTAKGLNATSVHSLGSAQRSPGGGSRSQRRGKGGKGGKFAPAPGSAESSPHRSWAKVPTEQVRITLHRAEGLAARDPWGTSDPFVAVSVGDQKQNTKVALRTLDPVWEQTMVFPLRDEARTAYFSLWDNDLKAPNDPLGKCSADLAALAPNEPRALALPVVLKYHHGDAKPHGTLHVTLIREPHGIEAAPLQESPPPAPPAAKPVTKVADEDFPPAMPIKDATPATIKPPASNGPPAFIPPQSSPAPELAAPKVTTRAYTVEVLPPQPVKTVNIPEETRPQAPLHLPGPMRVMPSYTVPAGTLGRLGRDVTIQQLAEVLPPEAYNFNYAPENAQRIELYTPATAGHSGLSSAPQPRSVPATSYVANRMRDAAPSGSNCDCGPTGYTRTLAAASPPPPQSSLAAISAPKPAVEARYASAGLSMAYLTRNRPAQYTVSPVPIPSVADQRKPLREGLVQTPSLGYRYIACNAPYTSTDVSVSAPLRNLNAQRSQPSSRFTTPVRALESLHTETFYDPVHISTSHPVAPSSIMLTADEI